MSQINCPTCGAKTDSIIANCEYCGVEFVKAQTLTPQEYIAAVGRAIAIAQNKAGSSLLAKDEADSTTLMSIPIPSDIPTLTAFFMFCHGNVKGGFDGWNPGQKAWAAKAKGSYDMLRLASLNNPQLSSFLEEFKSSYSAEAMKAQGKSETLWVIVSIVLLIAIIFAVK